MTARGIRLGAPLAGDPQPEVPQVAEPKQGPQQPVSPGEALLHAEFKKKVALDVKAMEDAIMKACGLPASMLASPDRKTASEALDLIGQRLKQVGAAMGPFAMGRFVGPVAASQTSHVASGEHPDMLLDLGAWDDDLLGPPGPGQRVAEAINSRNVSDQNRYELMPGGGRRPISAAEWGSGAGWHDVSEKGKAERLYVNIRKRQQR